MFLCLIASLAVIGPGLSGVVKRETQECHDFRCTDGTCIDSTRVCDGVADCADYVDEQSCTGDEGYCVLHPHHSVDYKCVNRVSTELKPCGSREIVGTIVVPTCKDSIYGGSPTNMLCTPSGWDHVAKCTPECGRPILTNYRESLTVYGLQPWHAAIYSKTFTPFMQICGGSIVTTTAVISAAHCFWKDDKGQQSPDLYAVAVGKIYRPWADTHDLGAQFFNISKIHIPEYFRGSQANFQSDIAVLKLATEIMYNFYIRPVCLDFDYAFNKRQLTDGNLGKMSGWSFTSENKTQIPVIKTAILSILSTGKCVSELQANFREYITADKFCARLQNDTTLNLGDSGAGLACPINDLSIERYYLRGVVSTSPQGAERGRLITFTQLNNHEHWLKELIRERDPDDEASTPAPVSETVTAVLPSGTGLQESGACTLPPYPAHGRYEVRGRPHALPGQPFGGVAVLTVRCDPRHAVDGNDTIILPCFEHTDLSSLIPPCTFYCDLPPHRSVEYHCQRKVVGGTLIRPCGDKEFLGTTVVPKCRKPLYRGEKPYMFCNEGGWSTIARCEADCGKTTPVGQKYITGGDRVTHGQIPWHVGVYDKRHDPYKQICGGSLMSTATFISAAHCFWSEGEGKEPANYYAAALGKIYPTWGDERDKDAQVSDVSEIHIPDYYHGIDANYQNDIAVVKLKTEIEYKVYIRPVCLSFELDELLAGILGKAAGWGYTSASGDKSEILKAVDLPYVPHKQCYEESPPDFHQFINGDKICAGFKNGTALCPGDSGGGLAFPENVRGIRYYLRGVVSVAPRENGEVCDPFQRTTFTEIFIHQHFIRQHE